MSVKVKFFASMREYLNVDEVEISVDNIVNVNDVWHLVADGKPMPENTLCALNLQHTGTDARVSDGDEIAFFPPVTGG